MRAPFLPPAQRPRKFLVARKNLPPSGILTPALLYGLYSKAYSFPLWADVTAAVLIVLWLVLAVAKSASHEEVDLFKE